MGPCSLQHGVCLHIENKLNIHIILLLKSNSMENKLSECLFGGCFKLL